MRLGSGPCSGLCSLQAIPLVLASGGAAVGVRHNLPDGREHNPRHCCDGTDCVEWIDCTDSEHCEVAADQ
jgi:hypothetical protein